jgi:hypothetical protein
VICQNPWKKQEKLKPFFHNAQKFHAQGVRFTHFGHIAQDLANFWREHYPKMVWAGFRK